MISGFHFLQPLWLIGLVVPLFWLWYSKQHQARLPDLIQQSRVQYPALYLIDVETSQNPNSSIVSRVHFLPVLFLVLLAVSLAQPVRDGQMIPTEVEADPVDLILVVNTSVSMILKDYRVDGKQLDRMAVTRLLLQRLVSEFKGNRVGLVVLGRPPSIWLPLTDDFALIKNIIGRLKTTLGGRNSDIGESLALIQDQFALTDDKRLHKIVMLVSDGYEQLGVSSPEAAVKKMRQDGISLHTLAIGSATKPEFSLGKGHLIYQPVDLELMTRLAKIGGGNMVHAKDMSAVKTVLDNLANPVIESEPAQLEKEIIPLYQYPLALSLIILLAMQLPMSLPGQLNRRA